MPEADDVQAEGDHTEINLQPLNDDCKLLGSLLDTCLKHEIGENLFQKVTHWVLHELLTSVAAM